MICDDINKEQKQEQRNRESQVPIYPSKASVFAHTWILISHTKQ